MAKYLVKHWINVDMIAEEVIEDNNINFENNDLGKYKTPSPNAKYIVFNDIKVTRTTYEEYGKNTNDSSTKPISNK